MNNQSTKDKDAISTNGMAATSHPIATEEAIRILKKDNTRKENRLEELGRVDAEKADTKKGKSNLKDEKKRKLDNFE